MKIASPWKRLQPGRFWRAVDAEHNLLIAEQLAGCRSVLDIGCGYGSLTARLNQAGFDAACALPHPPAPSPSRFQAAEGGYSPLLPT